MSVVSVLNACLGASVALCVAAVLLACLRALNSRLRVPFAQRHLLVVGYTLCLSAVLAPLVASSLPSRFAALPPAMQIWSGSSMNGTAVAAAGPVVTTLSAPREARSASGLAMAGAVVLAVGIAVHLARLALDLLRARRLIASSQIVRQRGRARVLVSDQIRVPLSLWLPGCSFVLLPSSWLLRPADLRIGLCHEAQHHRQLDTRLLYALQGMRAIFWWHPASHWLVRQVLELQEFACDEAVAGAVSTRREAYCRCLLRAAESVLHAPPLAAASIVGRSSHALLQRVQAALNPPPTRRSSATVALCIALAVVGLFAIAGTMAAPINDRRVTMPDAQHMADVARRNSDFPIVVNPAVLAELNALLGTPDGREFVRASRERMKTYQPQIEGELTRYGLPKELLAVPFVESGYRNRVAGIGGGLWMFIVPTARRFGLQVDAVRDDRTDVTLETDAAMRMLSELKNRFADWRLALLAYNAGTAHVEELMREVGSTDAFTLLGRRPGDSIYLPRVMAAVLILANPGVLD